MKYASCRIRENSAVFYKFEKDYNKVIFLGSDEIRFDDFEIFLKDLDYIDILFPASEILYFRKQYPAVKKHQLEMIVEQDIETITNFKSSEIIFDIRQHENNLTTVYIVRKAGVESVVSLFGNNSSKIRSIVPEHEFIPLNQREKCAVVGENYLAMLDSKSQIINGEGLWTLGLKSIARLSDDNEYKIWLSSLGKLDAENNSEEEILVKKAADNYIEKIVSSYHDFFGEDLSVVIVTEPVPSVLEIYFKEKFQHISFYFLSGILSEMPLNIEKGTVANFAKDDFAYKGGFNFYKRKMIAASLMIILAFVFFVVSMQVKISNVTAEIEKLDERSKVLTKEILGKEYSSLRQAVSVMEKTIKGDETNEKKKIYPFSSLYIMEELFPLLVFPESTIEIREFSFKDGKVRFVGDCQKLEDFNKMIEKLESHKNVKNINKGQIRNIKGKNDFSIGFDFVTEAEKKTKDEKVKKSKGAEQ